MFEWFKENRVQIKTKKVRRLLRNILDDAYHGARGSKEQIRQLTGMRGLMAKPKKASS